MVAAAVAIGVISGGFIAVVWHVLSKRAQTRPLIDALGKSMKSMMSDDGEFFRDYLVLLSHLGTFVFWNLLALSAACGPVAVVIWFFWANLEDHAILLFTVLTVVSIGGLILLKMLGRERETMDGVAVQDSQFLLIQLAEAMPWLMKRLAALESRLMGKRLAATKLEKPVFVTGLARSGTTMMLELLSQAESVATHRYRDFPFIMTPWFWNKFFNLFGIKGDRVDRPHKDGIQISPESPEAFEVPLWQHFFPASHEQGKSHVLMADDRSAVFDAFFTEHLRKIMIIRDGSRYLSKGNYNVTRIAYIAAMIPDARFIVPIRHPVTHIASLVRQHQLFCNYAEKDDRVPQYLRAAGHYEFGPQRVPVSVNGSGVAAMDAFVSGDEHAGYAMQWSAVYGHVHDLMQSSDDLAERVMVIRYEDFCESPLEWMPRILAHSGLEAEGAGILENLGHISKSSRHKRLEDDPSATKIWELTADVAGKFGYDAEGY